MADIKKLLNKKKWTGRELGIIHITNLATIFRQTLQGNPDPKPLVEREQLRKMINSLTDRTQSKIYDGYMSIYEWLRLKYNIALAFEQQAELRFTKLSNYVTDAMLAEDVYKYVEQLPLIMTQKQYDDFIAEQRKEVCSDIIERPIGLIYRAIEYYMELITRQPKKSNPLKPIRKKYLSTPIESEYILSRYNKASGNGYWITEDGLRSDQMTYEEWQEAISTPKMKQTLESMRDEESHGKDDIVKALSENEYLQRARLLYSGKNWAEAEKEIKRQRYEDGLATPAKFVCYDQPPADLTKWELLEDFSTLYEVFEFTLSNLTSTDEDYAEEAKIFLDEFKELAEFIINDIDSKFFKDTKGIADTPIEEWNAFTISWEQLYNMDFYGFKNYIDKDSSIILDGNQRAERYGIAILSPRYSGSSDFQIDEQGYYIPPEIYHSVNSYSLENFFTEAEDYAYNVEEVENGRKGLLDSYYVIKGYNTAIDLIAEYFDIPDIDVFKRDLERIERRIDAYNDLIPMLYTSIAKTDYEDEELKQRKLQVLKDVITPIDYKGLTIPEENIEEAKARFADFSAFNEGDIMDLLFYRPQEEDSERGGE